MNQDVKIEYYLLQLDRALQALSVSARAEIITEIKSHIRGTLDKEPNRSLDSVLASLGTPAQVAAPYLASKGLPLTPPARSFKWLKWLAITAAAFVAIIVFSGVGAIWYLSPLLQIDETKGRVTLLGGRIDINDELGNLRVGTLEMNTALKESFHASGSENLANRNVSLVKIPFNTAHLDVSPSFDHSLRWNCKGAGSAAPKPEIVAGVLTLNLDGLNLAKCSISLPVGASSEFHGVNGHMNVESPSDKMDIAITNGKVNIKTDTARVYDFEVNVKNGLQDFFPRNSSKQAVKVKVNVVNGMVKKE